MAAIDKERPVKHVGINTDNMAYSNCETRIISLSGLDLPTSPRTTEDQFRKIYTEYIANPANEPNSRHLQSAVTSLTTGIAPPVAFPTETVYGLGADATNAAAIAGIYAAKGRPSDNPLIVHVSSVNHLERLYNITASSEPPTAIPEVYRNLVAHFWPGPLTILLPVPAHTSPFAPNVHPGQKTIGFRVPLSPAARFLIAVTDRPIAAPSANSSGKPSPTLATHVLDDLNGKINFILDGGACQVGVESTVVDALEGRRPVILRPGGVSRRMLRDFGRSQPDGSPGRIWAEVENAWEMKKSGSNSSLSHGLEQNSTNALETRAAAATIKHPLHLSHRKSELQSADNNHDQPAPRAPGMKYKHYSPTAPLYLIERAKALTPNSDSHPSNRDSSRQAILHAVYTHIAAQRQQPTKLTLGVLPSTEWTAFGGLIEESRETNSSNDTNMDVTTDVETEINTDNAVKVDTELNGDPRIRLPNNLPSPSSTQPAAEAEDTSSQNIRTATISISYQDLQQYRNGNGNRNRDQNVPPPSLRSNQKLDSSQPSPIPLQSQSESQVPASFPLQLKLYSLPLGTTATTIAARLFSTLRSCDSLACDLIIAEPPSCSFSPAGAHHEFSSESRGEIDTEDEFETVLERMRKAAGGGGIVHLDLDLEV